MKFSKKAYKLRTGEIVLPISNNGATFSVLLANNGRFYYYPSMISIVGDVTSTETVELYNMLTCINPNDLEIVPQSDEILFYSEEPMVNIENEEHCEKIVIDSNPIVIVSASPKKNKEDTKLFKSAQKFNNINIKYKNKLYDIPVIQEMNNRVGLSEIYNSYINESFRDYTIVFVHDDVYIEDLFFVEKLKEAHEQFDVIGVAGSTGVTIKSPAYWHLMAPRQNLRGFCAHQLGDISNMTVFGNSKLEVDLIDGVFMSVKVSKLLDSNVRFDEDFDFHFYDLAFSKRVKNAGLKLGVWPIFITHFSGGGGNQRWKDLEPLFIKKYA